MKYYPALLILLLTGCSTPVVTPVLEMAPGFGLITFIRIEPEPAPDEVQVYIHDELVAVIGNESFVSLCLPEGTNTVTFDWEDSPIQFEEVFVMEPDQKPEAYLSMFRKFDIMEISKSTNSTDVTMIETLGFIELSPEIGKSVIQSLDPDYSYTAPEYNKF